MPWLRFALIAVVGIGLIISFHVYLYRRLVRDVSTERRTRQIGGAVLAALAVLMVAALPLNRVLPREIGEWVGFAAFGWMGVLAITVGVIGVLDVLRLPLAIRRRRRQEPLDPTRRLAISRGVATLATLGATATATAGVRSALSAPRVVEIDVPLTHLPPGLRGLRIAQLSDVHVGPTIGKAFIEDVVRRVNAMNVDLVAITGDLVDGTVGRLGEHVAPLANLKSRHGTFFVTGNHEYYSGAEPWMAELRRLGVRVLRNETELLDHGGTPLEVIGVDDWQAYGGDHGYAPDKAAADRDPRRAALMLAHRPRAVDDAARLKVDLMLSGHTHGGQIWPFGWFVRFVEPYVLGLHQHTERTFVYVSPGTGYWGPPMRVRVPAEITLLTLV
ncbi:MAG: metallophosphoesterase [Myxococcales bacterium]|nr:metallophosphoesterase [Myxococcales bacterium]